MKGPLRVVLIRSAGAAGSVSFRQALERTSERHATAGGFFRALRDAAGITAKTFRAGRASDTLTHALVDPAVANETAKPAIRRQGSPCTNTG